MTPHLTTKERLPSPRVVFSAPTPASRSKAEARKATASIAQILGLCAVAVYCLAPFYWMVVSSLRRPGDIFSLSLWPDPVSFENYAAVFDPSAGFIRALLNSVIVAGTTTAVAMVLGITTSYALARLRFRFRRTLLSVIVATSMFPQIALVTPLLKLFTDIGWINTYQAMILPSLSFALPLAVWVLTTFFKQMPRELEHSAMIDGCTRWQAFTKVILPIAAPGVVTTIILTFVSAWNEFLIALTMTNGAAYETATVALSKFSGVATYVEPFGSQTAAGVVVTIPLIILVIIFQRRIVSGLTAGAVK